MWVIGTDLSDSAAARLEGLLDQEERERAAAFSRAELRRRFITAHGATRLIVGGELGIAPESVKWQRGEHGKPALVPGPQVSMSRSGEFAALALASTRLVGVDIQRDEPGIDVVRMAQRFYPPDEARYVAQGDQAGQVGRFMWLWTRKEACVKVRGGLLLSGLRLGVRSPGVTAAGGHGWSYRVEDVQVPPGFHAAVAAEGPRPFELVTRFWPAGVMTT